MFQDGIAGAGAPECIKIIKMDRAKNEVSALWYIDHLLIWAAIKRILDGICCINCPVAVYSTVDGCADGNPFRDSTGYARMTPIYSPVVRNNFPTYTRVIFDVRLNPNSRCNTVPGGCDNAH